MARVYRNIADTMAHLPGVVEAVAEVADDIAARANALLNEHTESGRASIEITRGRTDSVVSLVDPAALSIEYGHADRAGYPVQGLHIMTRTAGL
ncbi:MULTISPECIES: DUF5403 family protein [unclassified Crossiella]|uniref:DUF5403 family protein n=1 Tax=unclassified Crossiella TaxID=2620835 RepID=UPI001FFE6BFD|nr:MULTISPECIES: DUF5403 family protein [unclassified Crossiella]MCK2237710.1 DUF5403 family protein [Crossiella sp. S99.2]MCK2254996.1 DUF5403 family protein [Crossiella sp. S99.1]